MSFTLSDCAELIVLLRRSQRALKDFQQETNHYARRLADMTGILGAEVPEELSEFQESKINAWTTEFERSYSELFVKPVVLVK